MAYGVKYQCTFDRIDPNGVNVDYTLQILEKDYGGGVTDVEASGVPVVHSYQTDDPKAPIKGSSLSINLLNKNGSLPLETFLSTNDDQFQVQFFWTTQLMFIGFLVQDDCSETILDYTHEINLSANDNLGLLKDVALDKAKVKYKFIDELNSNWATTAPHTLNLPSGAFSDEIQVGDQIRIHNIIFDVIYNVTDVSTNPDFIVAETVSTATHATTDSIGLYRPILFADVITIAAILDNCLAATNLEINTHVFCNFLEEAMDFTKSFIGQTLINPQTFLKDTVLYDDCYTILTKVLQRFNCTLFQAKGVWTIVHWDELRYSGYPIPGYSYDSDFNLLGAIKLNNESIIFAGFNPFLIEAFDPADRPDVYPESGLLHRVLRPYQFDKETFNFRQPAQLFRNFDLQTLGTLLSTSTTGSGPTLRTINEYAATWFAPSTLLVSVVGTYFIRVTLDNLNNEIDRVLVVNGDCKSYKIEVAAGDAFKYSFTFKTEDSQPGNINLVMIVELWDGTTRNFFHEDGTWTTGVGWVYNIPSGDNSNIWHSVTIDCTNFPIPYDGLLYCYLRVADLSAPIHETYYKDIRFEYTALINESTKIIGQTHENSQDANIKQNNDIEIFIDDSPRNSISGALFLPTMTGVLQDRTVSWFLNDAVHPHMIGQLTTFEILFWRRIVRTILEGTLIGLVSAETLGNHISMAAVFQCSFFADLNFVFGKLDIDYKNNKCTGTLYEIYDTGEVDSDLTATYEFKYLYAPK